MTAPRVAGDDGALPAERVEHRRDVGGLGCHVVRAARRRRRQSALLVHGYPVAAGELVHDRPEVVPRQARAAVQQQHRVALAGEPPAQQATLHLDFERFTGQLGSGARGRAHERTTQRKPMWLIPESTICGRRAAGR